MKPLEEDYLQEIGPEIEKIGYKCGVIAGGSYTYKRRLYKSLSEIRDLDILLFLPDRESITEILTLHQQDLDQILHLSEVDKRFTREDMKPLIQGYADAIRYSGINNLNQKISVKIIALDLIKKSFSSQKPIRINVLSRKDKRFYPHKTLGGQSVFIGMVNQRVNEELCILGDPDLIPFGSNYCLGVIADICLSGKILHESEGTDLQGVKNNLIDKITKKTKISGVPNEWSDILIRSDRIPQDFKENFSNQFPELETSKIPTEKVNGEEYTVSIVSPIIGGDYQQMDLKKKINSNIKEKRYVKSSGPFSSNSNYGLVVFDSGEKAFFKEMLNESRFKGEIYGLITASAYFNHLREPIYTDPNLNLLSYDWFPGDMLARQRLNKIDPDTFNKIMELELKRSEDHLNAYIKSGIDFNKADKTLYQSRIHDLFYGRLMGDRIKEYYEEASIPVLDHEIPFRDLMSYPLQINGQSFPSINNIIDTAKQRLNIDTLNEKEMVCGFGDAHSGNIICSNNLDDYTYVDYEFAGFHSPYLDIAKQLYNDTAYELFYSDKLPPVERKVSVSINNGQLVINHDYHPDKISRYIYKTKLEGIILPYRDYCREHGTRQDDDWKEILGSALFCCGLLTRNISHFDFNNFIINLSNSIEASNFDYYSKKYLA